jgi:hypothetical protein
MSRPSKYDDYAVELLDYLLKHPGRTRQQIQKHLNKFAAALPITPKKVPDAYSVIFYIRGVLGPQVITCDRRVKPAVYKVAESRMEARLWVNARKRNIRNQIERTHKAVVDIQMPVKAGGFGADKDMAMVQATLESVLTILDASLAGDDS